MRWTDAFHDRICDYTTIVVTVLRATFSSGGSANHFVYV